MYDIPNQVNGGSTQVDADEYNSHAEELEGIVSSSGQTLPVFPAPDTTNQLKRAVSAYARGLFCQDSGAVNAYELSRPNSNLTDVFSYFDGMTLIFETANANTGASSAKLDSLPTKDIVIDNTALTGGEITPELLCVLVYSSTNDNFELYGLVTKEYLDNNVSGGILLKESFRTDATRYPLASSAYTNVMSFTFDKDDATSDIYIQGLIPAWQNGNDGYSFYCSVDNNNPANDSDAFKGVAYNSSSGECLISINQRITGLATGTRTIYIGWKTKSGASILPFNTLNPNSTDDADNQVTATTLKISEVQV